MNNEIKIVQKVSEKWKCQYTYIGKKLFSRVDGFFHNDNQLKGVFEVRKKKQTYNWIKDYNSCLVSFNKLMLGAELSRILGVRFFYLVGTSDNKILIYRITEKNGKIVCPMNLRPYKPSSSMELNKNVNPKNILKFEDQTNAYLSLDTEFLTIIE